MNVDETRYSWRAFARHLAYGQIIFFTLMTSFVMDFFQAETWRGFLDDSIFRIGVLLFVFIIMAETVGRRISPVLASAIMLATYWTLDLDAVGLSELSLAFLLSLLFALVLVKSFGWIDEVIGVILDYGWNLYDQWKERRKPSS